MDGCGKRGNWMGRMEAEDGLQELKKRLTAGTMKLFPYRVSQNLAKHMNLPIHQRIVLIKKTLYHEMTMFRLDLLRALLNWLMKSKSMDEIKEMAPFVLHLRAEEGYQVLRFLLENATECLPGWKTAETSPPVEAQKQTAIIELIQARSYSKMDWRIFSLYDKCMVEMKKQRGKQLKSHGDVNSSGSECSKREWIPLKKDEEKREQFQSADEAFKEIITSDGRLSYHRRETFIWHNAPVASRLKFFKLKYKH